jgi:hypothetical protein
MGFFVFVIIAGIVGIAIYAVANSEIDVKEGAGSTAVTSGSHSDTPKPVTPAKESKSDRPIVPKTTMQTQKKEPQYISFYQYVAEQSLKNCGCCDGENEINAKTCRICGTNLEN